VGARLYRLRVLAVKISHDRRKGSVSSISIATVEPKGKSRSGHRTQLPRKGLGKGVQVARLRRRSGVFNRRQKGMVLAGIIEAIGRSKLEVLVGSERVRVAPDVWVIDDGGEV
jgi:hypothetical protein